MKSDFDKITSFFFLYYVLSLATSNGSELSACSLFYTYSPDINSFIVASSDETTHMKHIHTNNKVAGNILLETKNIGKIQGVQFKGIFSQLDDVSYKEIYFKTFPASRIMNPILWQIKVDYFKMTDNTLGFGKKIIWQDSSL